MENQIPPTSEITQEQSGANEPVAEATECLSAGSTLFWRVFIPIFGTVFLSGLLLTFLLIPEEELYLSFPLLWGRLFILAVWALWLLFIRRTLWRLKRVDANSTHFFVTNYWLTVRYPWSDVEKTTTSKHLGRRIASLWLRAPGRFGQKISFLPGDRFESWQKENPSVLKSED